MIGDGGFVIALEKRGYVKAGPWTPEATVEHPEAGKVYLCIYQIKYSELDCDPIINILLQSS